MTQDFIITDQASVWLFTPLTEAAQRLLREKIDCDEDGCLWQGNSLAVDYLAAGALTEELRDEGFLVEIKR